MISTVKLVLAAFCTTLALPSFAAPAVPLVNSSDTWRYHLGNAPLQADWKTSANAALDGNWSSGPGGFGYADGDDATVLSTMRNNYSTVRIRREFTIAAPVDPNLHLVLTMDWDDGFVAWLDGVELRRDRAPGAIGTEPATNAVATSGHEAAGGGGPGAVTYDLGPVGSRLGPGTHILALMGLNDSLDSSDLSLIASLGLTDPPPPTLAAHTNIWRYFHGSNAPPANWQTLPDASLGAAWFSGPGGIGYADGDDATVLSTMRSNYTTVYIRQTFNVATPIATNLIARLIVDYDDAYVAYLDGVEVARSANIVGGVVGVEPAYNGLASSTHEASGGSSGSPPVTNDLGLAITLLPPGDHVLALICLNEDITSSDLSLIANLTLAVAPTNIPGCVSGTIAANTNWAAADSPIMVCGPLTIGSGATLTIEPGVTVLINPGVTITVNGRLIAEGNVTNRIRFARNNPASAWTRILVNGGTNESRFAYCDVDGAGSSNIRATGSRIYVDNVWFTNTTAQLVDCNSSSLILKNCYIPGGAGVEPVHFTTMPANGYALIQGCVFGAPNGYNDSVDFTGGNRPGPIAQFLDNIFLGAVDDCFDMDGTDAHIEGNIFLNVRKDASRSSSSNPITTGADGGNRSELVICRNIFYNTEHVFMQKDSGLGLLQNNSVLRITPNPLSNNTDPDGDEAPGIIMFGEPWRGAPYGDGAIFEGNIASDLQVTDPWPILASAQNSDTNFFFIRNHNCVEGFPQPGLGNISVDPLFVSPSNLTAANIRQSLALQPGSPCLGTGPNGLDMGALVPSGASVSDAPDGTTTNTHARLTVAGPGIWAYQWRLNGGPWSPEVSLVPQSVWNGQPWTAAMFSNAPPITLSNLTDGVYTVEVIGRNSAGYWQDTNAAVSRSWTVATTVPLLIDAAAREGSTVTLTFTAQAGLTYSVLFRDAFDALHPWTWLSNVPAQGNTGPVNVQDTTASGPQRFYRIVTPAQP
jgi:hypothetical protein